MPSGIGKLLNYATPIGWGSLATNKLFGTGTIGDGYDSLANELSGAKGLETAAAGAERASADAKALSDLQWQRQMEGLQRAVGQMDSSQSLYNRIYGGNTALPSAQWLQSAPKAPLSAAPPPAGQFSPVPPNGGQFAPGLNQPARSRVEDYLTRTRAAGSPAQAAGPGPSSPMPASLGQGALADPLAGLDPFTRQLIALRGRSA